MEYNAAPAPGELPGRLAAGKATADDVNRERVMIVHGLRIATNGPIAWARSVRRGHRLTAVLLIPVLLSCAWATSRDPAPPTPDAAWVQSACGAGSPDARDWPRYRLGDIRIAVPPEYRVSAGTPFSLAFSRGRSELRLTLHRNAKYEFDANNRPRPGMKWCEAHFGGLATEVLAWFGAGYYAVVARWQAVWGGQDEGKWLYAQIVASRLRDATLLRQALHTIEVATDTVSSPAQERRPAR